ncbi:MAG TPA: mandelate racemase/muconate lactonizing enzyme family protein [Bryobacteraceae bacterium]|jgi:galactonate dehydratase|nr:mandelate racemase/muconate lactonizing enzyme family protein [Bryobacteraceae bacterium]
MQAKANVQVTGLELLPVRATERTVWLLVRLSAGGGLTGLGEASDAFGFANTTKQDAQKMEAGLRSFFELVKGRSPLDVEAYRQAGEKQARAGGLVAATAYSAIEQALWDLAAKSLGVPVHALFGGAVRDTLPVYANINRAARPRTPAGFADTARKAAADGFRALKAAPWDGFPQPGAPPAEVARAVDLGIDCVAAIRAAVGPDIGLMVDCHSFFDVPLARSVAQRLEPFQLAWYEEPVAPERTAETVAIHKSIRQPMAGGEILFGVGGFAPLCRNQAVDVIMPDVKHCGGLLEMTRIAAMADADGVAVAPHNPSGPVATAASVQICAGMKNFRILELQWGEVAWRGDLVRPAEKLEAGAIRVPRKPGFGIELDEKVLRAHAL